MFQALRLTEFVLIHGLGLSTVTEMMFYLSISFLPIIFPMSLLFSVLLTYGRLSQDSEIVAFRSIGLGMTTLLAPAFLFSLVVAVFSAQISFQIAPWGNRQFELLIHESNAAKVALNIKEKTFTEGLPNLVLYANEVNSNQGLLKDVFIYDERNPSAPLTIVADKGQILEKKLEQYNVASLRLIDGSIHKMTELRHTKLEFSAYDIIFSSPTNQSERSKSVQSLTLEEMKRILSNAKEEPKKLKEVGSEFHKRWTLAYACMLFGVLGVSLGTTTNRRAGRSSGFITSLMVLVSYWILFAAFDGLNKSSSMAPWIWLWAPSLLFTIFSIWSIRKVWR